MEILHDLKMQFVDLLLVMWIFWGQIGHKNYEDFEHPTFQGVLLILLIYPGRCPGLGADAPSGRIDNYRLHAITFVTY